MPPFSVLAGPVADTKCRVVLVDRRCQEIEQHLVFLDRRFRVIVTQAEGPLAVMIVVDADFIDILIVPAETHAIVATQQAAIAAVRQDFAPAWKEIERIAASGPSLAIDLISPYLMRW